MDVGEPDRTITVVSSADAAYVLPLTVMLVSLRAHLAARRHLDIHIIEEGISEAQKARLRQSLVDEYVSLSWHTPDRSRLVGVPVWGRLPVCVYNKLLVPDVLPNDVQTALWLDADTLVIGDISPLWDGGTGGDVVRAVQDPVVAFVSSDMGVARYRELRLRPDAKYFNCGVMLMNLARWREQRVSERALAYLTTYPRDVAFLEQEGLNAVLSEQWGGLDPQWNWSVSVGERFRQRSIASHVRIAHFSGNLKPWKHDSDNPYVALYHQYIDRTEFAGFRPQRRWHTAALRSYERAAFRRILLPGEQFALKLWRMLTNRTATADDIRTTP